MKKAIILAFLFVVLCAMGVYAAVPVADAGDDKTVDEDIVVSLDGSGSYDLDNDTITYQWTVKSYPSRATVTLSDPTVAEPTFKPNFPGEYVFELVVNDGVNDSSPDTVTITAERPLKLNIKDLDVKVGKDTDKNIQDEPDGYRIREEARPEDTVKFDIEVESLFDDDIEEEDIDIEDVFITITIEGIDDDEDLEEESDEFDLGPGKDESETLEFEVPLRVDEGDYDVIIEIEGEDQDGFEHKIKKEFILEVSKERHYIMIYRLNLNPSTVKCTRTVTLNAEIMNLGRDEEEDVTLEIMSDELGINSRTSPEYDLTEDWEDDDNTFEKVITFTVPENFAIGTYQITARTYYDSKLSETKTVDLVVEECVPVTPPVEEEEEEEEEEEVVVDYTEIEIPEEMEEAEEVEEVPFTRSREFYTMLVIVIILVVGLIIFLVGAFIIKASKRSR